MSVSAGVESSSFNNYIEDVWERSLDCCGWVQKFESESISPSWSNTQHNEIRSLFDKITQYLNSSVMLVDSHGSHSVKDISFHKRYGWTLSSAGIKAYLGKWQYQIIRQ